jgi:hypothetical protein
MFSTYNPNVVTNRIEGSSNEIYTWRVGHIKVEPNADCL